MKNIFILILAAGVVYLLITLVQEREAAKKAAAALSNRWKPVQNFAGHTYTDLHPEAGNNQ